jgi:hypothetical protein
MASMHAILWLLLLVLGPLASESQGDTTGPLHPRHRSLNGLVRRHAKFEAMLETFGSRVSAARLGPRPFRVAVVDGNAEHERNARGRGLRKRARKRITKRQLKKELKACRSKLEECTTEDEPRFLFIQMASSCTLKMVENRTFLSTPDMDLDTYGFTDRPYRYAATYPTTYFNGFLFNQLFAESPPNAAMTFNVYDGEADATFEGPLISILPVSTIMQMQPDNTTVVEYEIVQSPEQEAITPLSSFLINGSESRTFQQCSLFIDSEGDGQQAFLRPKNNLAAVAKRMQEAAVKLENAPATSPFLQKYAKVWQINGKGGVDSKDYLKGAADTVRATASFIEQCKKSCDSKDIVNGVSGLLMASAFVVGAAFPPLGIAMVVVGAIGMLVSALFLDSAAVSRVDTKITPTMIQDAVDRALTSFTVQADTETLKSFQTFFQIDINNYASFVGSLGYILEKNPDNGQQLVDEQIGYWHTQQYLPAWTGVYQKGIVDLETMYTTWFGETNPSGIRYKLKNYKSSCDGNTCKVTDGDTGFFQDGANRVKFCKETVDNARTNWGQLGQFANGYLRTASQLTNFASQAQAIFQMASNCDAVDFSESDIVSKCRWERAISDLSSKVSRIQARALYLDTVMKELSKECDPDKSGWPFTQSCKSDRECNYKYVLAISNTQYSDRLASTDQEGAFKKLDKSYSKGDSEKTCQNIYNWNHGSRGYGSGGLYGYTATGPSLKKGNCGDIADTANNGGYIILGAIPSFCINDDFPKCASNIVTDDLWGTTLE